MSMQENFGFAVVGTAGSIQIYKAIGAETVAVASDEEARTRAEELFRADRGDEAKTAKYAVLFIEENFYQNFPEDLIEKFTNRPLPAVIPVPSPSGDDNGFATNRLRKIVERAVGSDILG